MSEGHARAAVRGRLRIYHEGAMRHWQLLHRLLRASDPCDSDRCFLVVEQLEEREVLAPIVFGPDIGSPPETNENVAFVFSGSLSFFAFDPNADGQNYVADLTALNGLVFVDESFAASQGVAVSNNGTAAVTLVGMLDDINVVMQNGIALDPTAFYSGDALLTVTVTDLDSEASPGSDSATVHVLPVASSVGVSGDNFTESYAHSNTGFSLAGAVLIPAWPDLDGSETASISFGLDIQNTDEFTLAADGVPLPRDEGGNWFVTGSDPALLQSLVDSLVLTPPTGFTGRVTLSVFGEIEDAAFYSDETAAFDYQFLLSTTVPIRFFLGGNVTTPTVFGREGDNLDLGGRFVATDPDFLDGDTHSLTLHVPEGALTFDANAVPPGLSVEIVVARDGSESLLLTGSLDAINQFLATPGSMSYTAVTPFFSGVVPLTLVLKNQPGEGSPSFNGPLQASDPPGQFTGVASLVFVPVAGHAFPTAADLTTPQDTPVALAISITPLADLDGSESVLIVVEGVPAGANFNRGTNLGGGQWAFSPDDLAGLVLTPPPGEVGSFTLTVKTIVTDFSPSANAQDTAQDQTTFTITVTPVNVVSPPGNPVTPPGVPVIPPDDTADEPDFTGTLTDDDFNSLDRFDEDFDDAEADTEPDIGVKPPPFAGYTSGGGDAGSVGTETSVSYAPAQGSLFGQAESPQPAYAGSEKHPLPPVLPLDQTLPIAGFSETGGDSFALIDQLYRDAENAPAVTLIPPQTAATQPSEQTLLVVALPEANSAPPSTTEAESAEGEWRWWLGASVIVGSLAAWGWLSRDARRLFARPVRRFLRTH